MPARYTFKGAFFGALEGYAMAEIQLKITKKTNMSKDLGLIQGKIVTGHTGLSWKANIGLERPP